MKTLYNKIKRIALLTIILFPQLGVRGLAQNTRTISGMVKDGNTGRPLSGAVVAAEGAKEGASCFTDSLGHYEFKIPVKSSQLVITAPDHNPVHIGISPSPLQRTVSLYPTFFAVEYSKDNNLTNSVSASPSDYTSSVGIEEDIQKQLGAQVFTVMRNGTAGTGGVMRIAGLNTLNINAQPLVVVDGVVFDMENSRSMLHQGFYNDVLSAVSSADIERVTVMRNGTALYGAKAANGVILVETRRSHSMATRITASLSAGITFEPKHYDMMNGSQYKSYAADLLSTASASITDFKFQNPNPSYYYYRQYANNTNWNDYLYRTAVTQNYRVSVEGGDDIASYNLSLGYVKADSPLEENTMSRLNIRFNSDINFTKNFSTRFDASFSSQDRDLRDDGAPASYTDGTATSPSFLGYVKSPMLSPYAYSNGVLSDSFVDTGDESYLDEALSQYSNYNYKLANPLAINQYGSAENKNYFETSMFNVSATPKYIFGKHLTASEHFSYTLVNNSEFYYIPVNGVPDYYVAAVGAVRENEARALASKQNSVMSDTRVEWQCRYGDHDIRLFGGARVNWESYTLSTQLGYNTGNDKTPFMSSSLLNATSDGTTENYNSMDMYLQAEYNYLQRYYLQANLTAETSSRYGSDAANTMKLFSAPWALFPGVQASWVMTNEPWLAGVRGVDFLRLNVGYEVTGNDDIDCYAARSYFKAFTFMKSISALAFDNIGNTALRPETTGRLTAGLEANLLNNRVNFRFNFFTSRTSDMLAYQSLSYLSGLKRNWTNGGKLKNSGFDASLSGKVIAAKDWQWELGGSVGHYRNEILELPDNQQFVDTEMYGATIRSAVGGAAALFYGYRTKGVFATSEDAQKAGLYILADNGVDKNFFKAGDVIFEDVDGNGEINEKDMQVIGDPNPDFYGNIFTSLAYKRLRLDVNFNYSVGGDVYNYMRSQLEGGSRFMNQTTAMLNRWVAEGQVTTVPKATFQDPMQNSRFSDRWIEDGSYLRLKTVTLSYTLPMNTLFLKGFEFWIQANNLFTLSKYLGSDPEFAATGSVIGQGIDLGQLPQCRSVVAGIKIKL